MAPDIVHYRFDKFFFGKVYYSVHNKMDRDWKEKGILHRLSGHRNRDLLEIRDEMGKESFRAALLHRRLDRSIIVQTLSIPEHIREYKDIWDNGGGFIGSISKK